jgi:hypothetical protein
VADPLVPRHPIELLIANVAQARGELQAQEIEEGKHQFRVYMDSQDHFLRVL